MGDYGRSERFTVARQTAPVDMRTSAPKDVPIRGGPLASEAVSISSGSGLGYVDDTSPRTMPYMTLSRH